MKHTGKIYEIRGNQNSYIKEEQTTQCSKGKVQKDKQRSTTNTYKTKDRVARTLLKPGGTQVLWKGIISYNELLHLS
jgi:hypothetical protein